MSAPSKPLAFRLFISVHEYEYGLEEMAQTIWDELSNPDALQVRAVGVKDYAIRSHFTYVAKGGNAQDIRRRLRTLADEDDMPYGDYTTAVMVDLDALGLGNVDRIVASDALYRAILEVRETLLTTVSEPRDPEKPRPREELLPYDLAEPPMEEVREIFVRERTFYLTFRQSGMRRNLLQWDEIEMELSHAVDDLGREHVPDNSLLLKVGPDVELSLHYWLPAPKLAA